MYMIFMWNTSPKCFPTLLPHKKEQFEVFTWGHGGHGRLGLGQAKACGHRILGMIFPWQKLPGPWCSVKSGPGARTVWNPRFSTCHAMSGVNIALVAPLKSLQMFQNWRDFKTHGFRYCTVAVHIRNSGICWVLLGWPKTWHEPDRGAVRWGIPTVLSSSPGWFCWVKGEGWRRCAVVSTHERDDTAMLDRYVSIILQVPLMIQVHQVTWEIVQFGCIFFAAVSLRLDCLKFPEPWEASHSGRQFRSLNFWSTKPSPY